MKTTSIICQRFICMGLLLVIGFIYTPGVLAQHVTILPSGITPNQSGSIPRLSHDAILALPDPQSGDMAYDLTFECVRFYRKNKWVKLTSEFDAANPSMISWQIGGAKYDAGGAVATDADGNVYVAGFFQEASLFENTEVTGSIGEMTFFIAKYTNTGHLLWVQKIATVNRGEIKELILDASGNLYVLGNFYLNGTFGTTTFTSYGQDDIFVAKFNSAGIMQWVQQGGGNAIDESKAMCIDGSGNLYITGTVNGNVTFGGTNYMGNGVRAFIAKFNNNGTFQWIRRGGSSAYNVVQDITADASGKVTMIGHFSGNATFDLTTMTSAGQMDIYLVQYDGSGNLVWAKRIGGTDDDYSTGVIADADNNLIISGYFAGTFSIDDKGLISAGSADIFIGKLNSSGDVIWIKRDGGASYEGGRTVALDAGGNIYLAGEFVKPAVFGSTTLYGNGNTDSFVVKYNADGKFLWAKELKSYGQSGVLKIAADTKGNAYCTGFFYNKFSNEDIMFTSRGETDIFITRFRD